MIRLFKISSYIFTAVMVNAQTSINLSGKICNQANFPVQNMYVVIENKGLSDTTNADGEFRIVGGISSIENRYTINKPKLKFKNGQLLLNVTGEGVPVSFTVYDLKGAVIASPAKNEFLFTGEYAFKINNADILSSSVYICIIKIGNTLSRFRLINAGNGAFGIREFGSDATNTSGFVTTARSDAGPDSIRCIRETVIKGQKQILREYSFPIEKWIDTFKVTLDLIPYEAINFGLQEFNAGRIWPDQVGATLTEYPHAIKNYLAKIGPDTHDYQWWCSEFYSYALRVGRCPLYEKSAKPDWMIRANLEIKSWFSGNSEYIYKDSIKEYKPLPGDFCHIQEHSAMVWYVTGNDSLYTIEANGDLNGDGSFDNQLALVNRGPYKSFKGLLGYGRRTGVVGNSYETTQKRNY